MASEYPTKGRGGKGIKTANITEKNGALAGLMTVEGNEDLMVITNTGVMIRTVVANISQTGRSTQGVKVMRLDQDAKIVTFTTVQADEKDEEIVEENEQIRGQNVTQKKKEKEFTQYSYQCRCNALDYPLAVIDL